MTTIAIIVSIFIICLFMFCTIVYLSEIKREKEIRDILLKEQQQIQKRDENIQNFQPIILKLDKSIIKGQELPEKNKKEMN